MDLSPESGAVATDTDADTGADTGDPSAVLAPPAVSTREKPAAKSENRMRRRFAKLKIARQPPPGKDGPSLQPADPRPKARRGRPRSQRVPDAALPENVLRWTDGPRRRSGRRGPEGSGQARARAEKTGARSARPQRGDEGTRRQQSRSGRATTERAKAAQEAAVRRRNASAAAAGLLWTRAPEDPTGYRLITRLSDMRHGWLDGRHRLPRLPELPERKSVGESVAPAHEGPVRSFPVPVAALAVAAEPPPPAARPTMPPTWLQTPRMMLLCRRALELIRAEEQAYITDCAAYRRELSRFRKLRDAADEDLNQARATLARAQRPLTDQELSARRLAEQSTKDRPDSFVRSRRQAEWERRLAMATHALQAATAQLAEATREAELREELIRDRMAVARAAALRHHEFHMRRIATYLQQLVRTHKQGADLNMLLMRYPVGPDLPEWTRNPHASDESSGP